MSERILGRFEVILCDIGDIIVTQIQNFNVRLHIAANWKLKWKFGNQEYLFKDVTALYIYIYICVYKQLNK